MNRTNSQTKPPAATDIAIADRGWEAQAIQSFGSLFRGLHGEQPSRREIFADSAFTAFSIPSRMR
jgi:hypothetical protein